MNWTRSSPEPLTPSGIKDVLDEVRDHQAAVMASLVAWLQISGGCRAAWGEKTDLAYAPSKAALRRLAEAREREDDVFRVVLDQAPALARKKQSRVIGEPWLDEGISRSEWYRRQKQPQGGDELLQDCSLRTATNG